jgi:hypothetical protein
VIPNEQEQGIDSGPLAPALVPTQSPEDDKGDMSKLDALLARAAEGQSNPEVKPSITSRVSAWFRENVSKSQGMDVVDKAVGRGVMKGADELSNTIVGAAVGISRKTGLYKLGRDEQQEKTFEEWYENSTVDQMNPFQFGEERRKRIFGADEGGVLGVVEGAAQFATGMLGAAQALKPFAIAGKVGVGVKAVGGTAKAGAVVGTLVEGAAKGLVTDMTAFDAHADRISNLVENGPEWMSNPVSRYLKNEADDSELEARLKAGLEGLVLGSTIDGIVFGVKAAKISRMWKKGDLTEDAAQAAMAREARKTLEGRIAEPVQVVPDGEGRFALVNTLEDKPLGKTFANSVDAEEAATKMNNPSFVTRAEAENHAAAINSRLFNEQLTRAAEPSPAFVEHFRELQEAYHGAPPEDFQIVLDRTAMNLRWDLSPYEVQATMKAAIDADPSFVNLTRTVEKRSWAETEAMVKDMFPGHDPEAVLAKAAEVFDGTAHLDVSLLHLKQMVDVMGAQVNRLNRIAQANPDNAIAFGNLVQSLDRFAELQGYFGGAKSQVARGLAVLRKGTGGAAEEAIARNADEVVEDAAKRDPKVLELVSALDEVQQAKSANKTARANKDTEAVTATEVQLKRVWDKWQSLLKPADDVIDPGSAEGLAHRLEGAAGIEDKARSAQAAGLTTTSVLPDGPAGPANPIMDLASMIDNAERQLTKQLENARAEARAKPPKQVNPVDQFVKGETMDGNLKGDVGDKVGPSQLTSNGNFALSDRAPRGARVTEGLTRQEILALSRQISLAEGDAGQILLALRAPRRPTHVPVDDSVWKRFFINFRINAMLSGPKTLVTNAVNNAVVSAQMPLEMFWAGKVSGNKQMAQQGWDTLVGLTQHYKESWAMARKAWKVGQNILDVPRPELGQLASDDITGVNGALLGVMQTPTRFLMATDEFFKQLNYRANMRGQILRQAREQGITDPAALAARLVDDMHFSTDIQGGAVNPLALQYSRVATFTNDLGEGTVGKWIQDGVNKHPTLRFIAPFVRTPVNIFRFPVARTPGLARLTKDWKEAMLSGDPERIALVKGRESFGAMFVGTAAALAFTNQITGAGPSDPDLRRQLKDTGWQPYSIKIPGTDQWVSYRRGDPTMAHFGLIADLVQISSEFDDDELMTPLYAATASVMSNMASKTFMQGVTEVMDAMSAGRGDKVKTFINSSVSSFVPNIARQLDPNDTVMETRSLIEELQARVPGFSTTLEPRRNVLGEKIIRPPGYVNRAGNPFTVAPGVSKDDVLMEMTRLGEKTGQGALTLPMESMESGQIDLTDRDLYDNGDGKRQSPYDRMQQLMGPEDQGGRFNVRGMLSEVMQSPAWQDMTDEVRFATATDIIQSMQEAAQGVVMVEYPKLAQALGQAGEFNATKDTKGKQAAKEAVMAKYSDIFIRMK